MRDSIPTLGDLSKLRNKEARAQQIESISAVVGGSIVWVGLLRRYPRTTVTVTALVVGSIAGYQYAMAEKATQESVGDEI